MNMTIDFKTAHPPEGPVVVCDHACLGEHPAYDAGMEDVSFGLERGELVAVLLEQGGWEHPLGDMVSGLIAPDGGEVRVFGQSDWTRWDPDRQARGRWRIGRVLAGYGWLSNLDVDENITLAERHHTRRGTADIMAEAQRLAAMVGLTAVPSERPSVTDHEELRRAAWVRAALGHPWLMILELPGRDLAAGWMDDLLPLVAFMREQDAAVLWLCGDEDEWNDARLNPSLKLRAAGNRLENEATT